MKARLKAALITLALAVALPAVAWLGTFLYWHITIKREIASVEIDPPPMFVSNATFLQFSGGCRALPYLIEVLETSRHPWILSSAVIQVELEAEEEPEVLELFNNHAFRSEDSPEVRRANYRKVREWWEANRSKYHQWWRVWSSRCSR